MKIAGIDPSMSSTGVAIIDWPKMLVTSVKAPKVDASISGRLSRASIVAGEVDKLIADCDVVVIENYQRGGMVNVALVEFQAMLRYAIYRLDTEFLEVAPTQLKKFVTGKGNASKAEIVSKLSRAHNIQFTTDDEADALGLAIIGATYSGVLSTAYGYQDEVIAKIRSTK